MNMQDKEANIESAGEHKSSTHICVSDTDRPEAYDLSLHTVNQIEDLQNSNNESVLGINIDSKAAMVSVDVQSTSPLSRNPGQQPTRNRVKPNHNYVKCRLKGKRKQRKSQNTVVLCKILHHELSKVQLKLDKVLRKCDTIECNYSMMVNKIKHIYGDNVFNVLNSEGDVECSEANALTEHWNVLNTDIFTAPSSYIEPKRLSSTDKSGSNITGSALAEAYISGLGHVSDKSMEEGIAIFQEHDPKAYNKHFSTGIPQPKTIHSAITEVCASGSGLECNKSMEEGIASFQEIDPKANKHCRYFMDQPKRSYFTEDTTGIIETYPSDTIPQIKTQLVSVEVHLPKVQDTSEVYNETIKRELEALRCAMGISKRDFNRINAKCQYLHNLMKSGTSCSKYLKIAERLQRETDTVEYTTVTPVANQGKEHMGNIPMAHNISHNASKPKDISYAPMGQTVSKQQAGNA